MFNKKSKIILGCLAFLLALSVGYALFSDTINVSGKATAKASFDISATCTKGLASELKTDEVYISDEKEHGYSNESCTVNGNNVTINVNLDYPTARRYYTIKFTNNGTLPAAIHIDQYTTEGIINNSVVSVKNSTGTQITNNLNQYPYYWYFDEMTGANLFGLSMPGYGLFTGDVEESGTDDWGYTMIFPGESLYAVISAIWDESDEFNYADNGAYLDYDLSYEFNFTQPSQEVKEYWEGLMNQQ